MPGPRRGPWNEFYTMQMSVWGENIRVFYRWRQVGGRRNGHEEYQRQERHRVSLLHESTQSVIDRLSELQALGVDARLIATDDDYEHTGFDVAVWVPVDQDEAREAYTAYEELVSIQEREYEERERERAARQLARIRKNFPDMLESAD